MTDQPPTIRAATPDDRDQAINTIVLGFSSDPFCRWMWPQSHVYLDAMTRVAGAFGGNAFDAGSALLAEENKAAALWLAPGVHPDGDVMEAIIGETVSEDIVEDVGAVFEEMDRYHPDDDIWYLPLIAADPAHIGQGLGGALMKHATQRADAEGKTAYLESSNPQNISLYLRHGFEIMGEIQFNGSPVMTPMIREPR